jgi:hypothetical protein
MSNWIGANVAPSALAAIGDNRPWIIGEANSVACEGNPNVTDTYAQALFSIAQEMTYASMGASRFFLHQGATLKRPGSGTNEVPTDGSPSYSAYSFLYPTNSTSRGERRVNPGFTSQLIMAEAIGKGGKSRFAKLLAPPGVEPARFFGVAVHDETVSGSGPARLLLLNTTPSARNSTSSAGNWSVDINELYQHGQKTVKAKRMTAPYVDEQDASMVSNRWRTRVCLHLTDHFPRYRSRGPGRASKIRKQTEQRLLRRSLTASSRSVMPRAYSSSFKASLSAHEVWRFLLCSMNHCFRRRAGDPLNTPTNCISSP